VNIKAFFVDTLSSALELGIATADDVLRHVTPDVLSVHLPRPLWARLLTAALGAPKVDAQLVIETIGVPNLCEHVPSTIIWPCIAEVARRALAGVPAQPLPIAAPPPEVRRDAPPPELRRDVPPQEVKRDPPSRGAPVPAAGASPAKPADELADVVAALESDARQPAPARSRTPTGQRFRQSSTSVGRFGAVNPRRPQVPVAAADEAARAVAAAPGAPRPARRGPDAEAHDVESEVREEWKSSLSVEDDQLVDWQGSEETVTSGEQYRKR